MESPGISPTLSPSMSDPIIVRPCRSPRRFLDAQRQFYEGDPNYVPPLTAADKWQVDRRKNPWFEHGDATFLTAERYGKLVGRISAASDRLHDEFHGDRIGFFGHFEAADEAVAHTLLREASAWAVQHGRTALRGPVDLSTNYRCGLLVEGDPGPPVVMMPYNPPHYAGWLESYGLAKAKDLLAIDIRIQPEATARWERVADKVAARAQAATRRVDFANFGRELDVLWDLYHRIWERNWGFAPMSEAEFRRQAKDLKKIADPGFLQIVEVAGEPAGFVVVLPDINSAIQACNGRLVPLGFWRFLRALEKVTHLRVLTLGILPEHRNRGLEMLLMLAIIRHGVGTGRPTCESSWILEDNLMMIRPLVQQLGGREYRRYRIYEKPL